MDSKILYVLIAVIVVVLGGVVYMKTSNQSPVPVSTESTTQTSASQDVSSTTIKTTTMDTTPSNKAGAIIHTNLGDIEVAFDAQNAPKTVENFTKLASESFYTNVRFHRVIKGFMIQAGDPNSKDPSKVSSWGMGGPGYTFADELSGKEQYSQGTLAMANAGPNTNGSQFFIVTASPSVPLPPSYTVFGKVVNGLDVALKIENVKTGQSDRPVEDVIITSVELK